MVGRGICSFNTIEHKVAHMKAKCARMEIAEIGAEITVPQVERMQCITEEFSTSSSGTRKLLTNLCAKMDAPAQLLSTSHNDFVVGLLGNEIPVEWVWGAKPRILGNIMVKEFAKRAEHEL